MHQSQLHLTESHSAQLRGQVRRPESALANFFLQGLDEGHDLVVGEVERLDRKDFLVHETTHPREFLLELGFGLEVPRHWPPTFSASLYALRKLA